MNRFQLLVLSGLLLCARSASADDAKRECVAAATDGQTLRNQGKLVAARERFLACSRPVCPEVVQAHCSRWLEQADAKIPTVVIHAQDATGSPLFAAQLTVDGKPEELDGPPIRLDPGEHEFVAETVTGIRVESRLSVEEGDVRRVIVIQQRPATTPNQGDPAVPAQRNGASGNDHKAGEIASDASAPKHPRVGIPVGTWILGSAGVLSLGAAAFFAYEAKTAVDVLREPAPQGCSPNCTTEQTSSARNLALATDVALGVGLAGLGGAVAWAWLAHESTPETVGSLRLVVEPLRGGALTGLVVRY
jgi:hypothetical protein